MTSARTLLSAVVLTTFALAGVRAQTQPILRTFDSDTIGSAPAGFTLAMARQQTVGTWRIAAEGANRYLSHLADSAATGGLSLAVLDVPHPAQVRASVRLKLTEGERAGGIVWRYQDAENFYLVSLDLGIQELALYRIVRGNRIRLEEEDDLELDVDAWHSVRVVHDDDDIRVSLGGIGVMRARDREFAANGRAGVWSAGGGTAWFDDLRVEEERSRERRR